MRLIFTFIYFVLLAAIFAYFVTRFVFRVKRVTKIDSRL